MNLMALIGRIGSRIKDSALKKQTAVHRAEAQVILKKLQYLRIADPQVSQRLQPLLAAGEAYLQGAGEKETWDPLGHRALEETLEDLKIFLTEADETAVEKRFSLEDQNPFPRAKQRILESLDKQLKILKTRTEEITGLPPGDVRLQAKEVLE